MCNSLGTTKKKHKLCAVYWVLANLPHSSLSSIYLAVLCKSNDVKTYGYGKVLEPLLRDPRTLEEVYMSKVQYRVQWLTIWELTAYLLSLRVSQGSTIACFAQERVVIFNYVKLHLVLSACEQKNKRHLNKTFWGEERLCFHKQLNSFSRHLWLYSRSCSQYFGGYCPKRAVSLLSITCIKTTFYIGLPEYSYSEVVRQDKQTSCVTTHTHFPLCIVMTLFLIQKAK